MKEKIGVILVAGGIGTRMKTSLPKQYLSLKGKAIARHSFDVFISLPQVEEMVVVCSPEYQHYFSSHLPTKFAPPGERRQDSVWNGFQLISKSVSIVCIHDSARPLIERDIVERVLTSAQEHGAAVAAIPLKFTVKLAKSDGFVERTQDRSRLWEIQTPQVIRREVLAKGFEHAQKHQLTVTDDVALVEHIGLPVRLVEGCHRNLKITTQEDLIIAEALLSLK